MLAGQPGEWPHAGAAHKVGALLALFSSRSAAQTIAEKYAIGCGVALPTAN